jgi:hypothetical protein
MRKLLLLLSVLFLSQPLWAAPHPIIDAATAFQKAVIQAKSWDPVLPHLTAKTIKALKSQSAKDQADALQTFQKLQPIDDKGKIVLYSSMKVKTRKVQGNKCHIEFQQPKGASVGLDLVQENGVWKVELQ